MKKETRTCSWCGASVTRYPSQFAGKKHIFCSRECMHSFENKSKNPNGYMKDFSKGAAFFRAHAAEFNKVRMTPEVRAKLRQARMDTGEGKTYSKYYGRHTHRVVAEQILGRPLLPGEVVHHIDGDKRNNAPENLMVFKSQREHAAWHAKHRGGGDNEV